MTLFRRTTIALLAAAGLSTLPAAAQEIVRKPTFEVYGFAMVDFIQDFKRVAPDWNATLRPTRIPTTPGQYGANGESVLSPRQTRFGVRGSVPAGDHDLYARVEFDIFGLGMGRPDAGGQNTVRLRHAYGTWGPLLGGITESTFMDADFWPNTIDYWGPSGLLFYRNVQIRYTPISGTHTLAVAIERSITDLDPTNGPTWNAATGSTSLAPRTLLPDLAAHYRYTGDGWYVQAGGLLRYLGYDSPGAATQVKGSTLGWGLTASSIITLVPERMRLLLQVVGGAGASYDMNDAGPDAAFGGTLADPVLKAVPMLAGTAYLDVFWSKLLSSSVGYSTVRMFPADTLMGPGAFQQGQYASVNLLCTPVRNLLAGPEFLWGMRTDQNGASGTDLRLQVSVKFAFSSLDFWKPG